MLKIGGAIRLGGKSLEAIKKEKDGGAEFYFGDHGSCETFLRFSPENFRRMADAALRFQLGTEKEIRFAEEGGEVSAEDLVAMLDDQAVRFRLEEPVDNINDVIPTIIIQPSSEKNDPYSGLSIRLNENQAAELVRRLTGFLEAAKLRRDAAKTKRIDPPARTKRTSVRTSV